MFEYTTINPLVITLFLFYYDQSVNFPHIEAVEDKHHCTCCFYIFLVTTGISEMVFQFISSFLKRAFCETSLPALLHRPGCSNNMLSDDTNTSTIPTVSGNRSDC